MGIYDGIDKAEVSSGGQYFKPGQYRMRIQSVSEITSRKNITFFVVESVVLDTTCEDYQPGATISWLVNMSNDYALGNVKEFAQALGGDMSLQITGADIEKLISDEQPAAGHDIDVDAITRVSRAGHEWTQARWRPNGSLAGLGHLK